MTDITPQTATYKGATRSERMADWLVGVFSPKRRALRGHFRRFEHDREYRDLFVSMMSARGYRSAKSTTGATPWMGGNRSADAEILNDINAMTARQRELHRDDPMGSGISHTLNVNTIGDGMMPQANTGDPDKNKRIEKVFNSRKDHLHPTDDMTYSEAQQMKFHKAIEDGNTITKEVRLEDGGPLSFEVIEVDRLGMPMGEKIAKGHEVRRGVEYDANGVRVAYWISTHKPTTSFNSASKLKFERVPAEIVKHLRFKANRPGQTLGVPVGHAVMQDIRDIDLLIIAALKRTQIAACIAAFIKSEAPLDEIFNATAQKYGFQLDETITPGMIWKLYPGEELQSFIPNLPIPEFIPFIVMLAQRVGVAIGISWQEVLRDFSKSNYSSMRGDKQDSRSTYRVWQKWFARKQLEWEWIRVIEDEKDRGNLELRDVTPEEIRMVDFIPRGWDWVDPLKEAAGAQLDLQMRITSRRRLCAQKGLHWEDIEDELILEEKNNIEKREKAGLPPAPMAEPMDERLLTLIRDEYEKEEVSNV